MGILNGIQVKNLHYVAKSIPLSVFTLMNLSDIPFVIYGVQ